MPSLIREDSEMANLVHRSSDVLHRVRGLDADEEEEPGIDRAHNETIYLDEGSRHALHHDPHGWRLWQPNRVLPWLRSRPNPQNC